MPEHPAATRSGTIAATACLIGLLWSLLPLAPASASDTFTVDLGYGLEDTTLLRLNLSLGDDRPTPPDRGWYLTRSWEANLSYWHLYKHNEGEQSLFELGLTPNFRLERESPLPFGRPYLEAGLGAHLLSKEMIGTRELGSKFLFGTHAGFGLRLGSNEQYEFAWRIEHLSNAGLEEPNPGINFSMVRFGYRW